MKKIYADSELEESVTIQNFRIVQTEGSEVSQSLCKPSNWCKI